MARTVLEIFLSSTAADLKPHREAVYSRLTRIEFFKCIRQEDFGAQDAGAVHYCCERARTADLFVGLIGMRRGWEPDSDNSQRSITEMEYDSAKEAGRPRYVWVSPDSVMLAANEREPDAVHGRQVGFRGRVMGGGERIISQHGFTSSEALASDIVEQLLAHVVTGDLIKLLRPDLIQAAAGPVEGQKPAIAAAVEKLAEDKDIDLLALAKDPKGLNITELEGKLTKRANVHEAAGREASRTSAEYWRHIGALAFLHNTRKALAAYEKAHTLDPDNVEALRFLGELQYRLGDLANAAQTFSALIALGKRTNNKIAESAGHLRAGWVHRSLGALPDAEIETTKALHLAESAQRLEGMARAYANLGNIHQKRSDLGKAEEMHRKALAIDEDLGSKENMARARGNLGLIYSTRGELDKAEAMQRSALALEEGLGSNEGIARAYGNLGIIHLQRGELDKAEQMQRRALALYEDLAGKDGIARAYANLGNVHQERNDLDNAEEMQRKALTLYENLGSKEGIAYAHTNLGSIYFARGDLSKAEEMHRHALTLNEQLGRKEGVATSNWNLAAIHERKGEIHQLCDCLRRARDLWEQIGLSKDAADADVWMKRVGCSV